MKLLFDFLPVLFFFLAYRLFDFYTATIATMLISLTQIIFFKFIKKKIEFIHIATFIIIAVLGTATILLKNELFLKWKPTVLNWILAGAFLATHFSKKTLIERMLSSQLEVPSKIWVKLNLSWAIFSLLMGTINLFVAYNFSTNIWVNFKLFGMLGLSLVFASLQAVYISQFMDLKQNKM